MSRPPLRVLKLGGSLLEWGEMPSALSRWLAAQPLASNVLVVGGGAAVESLRRLDQHSTLSPEAMHWLCISAMRFTADLVAQLLPEARLVHALSELRRDAPTQVQIFEVEQFLRDDARRGDALPRGWEVTSDSIAARLAHVLEAAELVLLKSTLPDAAPRRSVLVEAGYVDRYFARASAGMLVRCVNLRDPRAAEIALSATTD